MGKTYKDSYEDDDYSIPSKQKTKKEKKRIARLRKIMHSASWGISENEDDKDV